MEALPGGSVNAPAKYTKKPVTIEAMQWTRDTTMGELKDFTNDLIELDDVDEAFFVYDRLHDSWIKFVYGDWIIKGLKGEFYPCADETFQMTYETEREAQDRVVPEIEPIAVRMNTGEVMSLSIEERRDRLTRPGFLDPYGTHGQRW